MADEEQVTAEPEVTYNGRNRKQMIAELQDMEAYLAKPTGMDPSTGSVFSGFSIKPPPIVPNAQDLQDMRVDPSRSIVDAGLRTKMKLADLSPAEQISELMKAGYPAAWSRVSEQPVIWDKKTEMNTVLDPEGLGLEQGWGAAAKELGQEALENVDEAALSLPSTKTGALVAGPLIAALRQGFKKLAFPDTSVSGASVLKDSASPYVGVKVGGALGKLAGDVVNAPGALRTAAVGGLADATDAAVSKASVAKMSKPAVAIAKGWEGVKQFFYKMAEDPKTFAKDLGATGSWLNPEKDAKYVVPDVKWLKENIPEKLNFIKNKWTFQKRYEAADALRTEVSNTIKATQEKANGVVTYDDIFSTDAYKQFLNLEKDVTKLPVSKEKAATIKGQFLTQIAQPYEGFLSKVKVTDPRNSEVQTTFWNLLKDGVYGEKELSKQIGDAELPLHQVLDMRRELDGMSKWASNATEIPAAWGAYRAAANTMREVGRTAANRSTNLTQDELKAYMMANDTYHHLAPIMDTLGEAVSGTGGFTSMAPFMGPQIGSVERRIAAIGNKVLNEPTTRQWAVNFLRKGAEPFEQIREALRGGNILRDEGQMFNPMSSMAGGEEVVDTLKSGLQMPGMMKAIPRVLSGHNFRGALDQALVERDPNVINNNPEMLQQLLNGLPPEVAPDIQAGLSSPDPSQQEGALAAAMQINPQIFQPSQSGYLSEIMRNGKRVLVSPEDIAVHINKIQTMFKSKQIDSEQLAKQLSAFNDPNDGELLDLQPPLPQQPTPVQKSKYEWPYWDNRPAPTPTPEPSMLDRASDAFGTVFGIRKYPTSRGPGASTDSTRSTAEVL